MSEAEGVHNSVDEMWRFSCGGMLCDDHVGSSVPVEKSGYGVCGASVLPCSKESERQSEVEALFQTCRTDIWLSSDDVEWDKIPLIYRLML